MYARASLRARTLRVLRSMPLRLGVFCGIAGVAGCIPDIDKFFPWWAGTRPAHMAILIMACYFSCYSGTRIGRLLLGSILERRRDEHSVW